MPTQTDRAWTERLANIMPENFMNNISSNFQDNSTKMFLDTMMNRIGLTVISQVDRALQPFAKYTGPVLDYGDTVQKYKVDYVKGEVYNPDAVDPFSTTKNKPYPQYNVLDDSVQYHDRVNQFEMAKAFTNSAMLGDFVAAKLDAIYESDTMDKYTKWKKYLSDFDKYGAISKVAVDESDPTVYYEDMWKQLRSYANSKFRQPSNEYNIAGLTSISPSVDIIMKQDDRNAIDYDILKGVFNLEKTDVDANFIYVNDFATPENIPEGMGSDAEICAIIVDSRAPMYYPRTPVSSSIYNPKGLNMEYYLTIQGSYCLDKFRNCVALYKATDV